MSRVLKVRSPVFPGAEGARFTITDDELLCDLRRVAGGLGKTRLSFGDYYRTGRFSCNTVCRRFGSWTAALNRVGLEPANHTNISAAVLLADIRRVADLHQPARLRANQYLLHGKYSAKIVNRLFGRWQTAAEAAGLLPVVCVARNERELFENLKTVWQKLGHRPRYADLKQPMSKFGAKAYTRRFGTLRKALQAFLEWQCGTRVEKTPTPRGPRSINLRLRFMILRRDHFRCVACGQSPATDNSVKLHVDHIKPWSKGGQTIAQNLQTLCQTCNLGKSDLQ